MRQQITRTGAYGVVRDGRTILLCRTSAQVPTHQGWWTLPGGGLEFGEHPEAAMVREVEEETGLIVRPKRLIGINSFTVEHAEIDYHSMQIFYDTEVISGTLRNEQGGTTDLCEWHPLDHLGSLQVVETVHKALALSSDGG